MTLGTVAIYFYVKHKKYLESSDECTCNYECPSTCGYNGGTLIPSSTGSCTNPCPSVSCPKTKSCEKYITMSPGDLCPGTQIKSKDICTEATGSPATPINDPSFPSGCYLSGKKSYFNTSPTAGSPNNLAQPICNNSPATCYCEAESPCPESQCLINPTVSGKYNCTGYPKCEISCPSTDCCKPGTYKNKESKKCTPCESGYYTSSPGSVKCTPCPGGSYTPSPGSTKCAPCPSGYGSSDGSTKCTPCPPSVTSLDKCYSGCKYKFDSKDGCIISPDGESCEVCVNNLIAAPKHDLDGITCSTSGKLVKPVTVQYSSPAALDNNNFNIHACSSANIQNLLGSISRDNMIDPKVRFGLKPLTPPSRLAPMQNEIKDKDEIEIKDKIKCGKISNKCNQDDKQKYICMANKIGPAPVDLSSANTYMPGMITVGDNTDIYDNSKFQYLNESSPSGDTVRKNCIAGKIPWINNKKLNTVLVENPNVNWFRKNTN